MCFVGGGWTDQDEWLLIWSDLIFQTRWSGIVGTFRSGCYGQSISTGFRRWERLSKTWMGKIYVPWARKTSDSVRHSAVKRYTHIWIYGNQVKYSDQYACTKSTLDLHWALHAKNCSNSGLCKISNMKIKIVIGQCEFELNCPGRKVECREVNLSTLLYWNTI